MKVKKYKASTMQEAMQLVRLELGDEAVILNSKAVKTSKFFGFVIKKGVEVIAALDEDSYAQPVKIKYHQTDSPMDVEKVGNSSALTEQNMMESISEIKRMMKGFVKGDQRDSSLPDYFFKLEEKLLKTDIHSSLKKEAIEAVYNEWQRADKSLLKNQMIDVLQTYFEEQLKGIDFYPNIYSKKFICLVGPTGVGKTTTLAKLAADAVLKHGKSIGFITVDTYRIAAIEQLKTYANILDAPIEVCYNAGDFQAAKEKFAQLDLVFVDTAGRNFLEDKFVKDIQEIIDFQEEITTFLVLSLTSKLADMMKITEQFWKIGIHQFIFTKKDETSSTSSMFSIIHRFKKGAAYMTNGQSVPEDLIPPSNLLVVKELLKELEQ